MCGMIPGYRLQLGLLVLQGIEYIYLFVLSASIECTVVDDIITRYRVYFLVYHIYTGYRLYMFWYYYQVQWVHLLVVLLSVQCTSFIYIWTILLGTYYTFSWSISIRYRAFLYLWYYCSVYREFIYVWYLDSVQSIYYLWYFDSLQSVHLVYCIFILYRVQIDF